jgi:hypothetical protein
MRICFGGFCDVGCNAQVSKNPETVYTEFEDRCEGTGYGRGYTAIRDVAQ